MNELVDDQPTQPVVSGINRLNARGEPLAFFAFGPLMAESAMHKVCPNAQYRSIARLDGFEPYFTKSSRYGAVFKGSLHPAPNKFTFGILYDINDQDWIALCQHASAPFLTQIDRLQITNDTGARLDVVGLVQNHATNRRIPEKSPPNPVLQAAKSTGLPAVYLTRLEQLKRTSGRTRIVKLAKRILLAGLGTAVVGLALFGLASALRSVLAEELTLYLHNPCSHDLIVETLIDDGHRTTSAQGFDNLSLAIDAQTRRILIYPVSAERIDPQRYASGSLVVLLRESGYTESVFLSEIRADGGHHVLSTKACKS